MNQVVVNEFGCLGQLFYTSNYKHRRVLFLVYSDDAFKFPEIKNFEENSEISIDYISNIPPNPEIQFVSKCVEKCKEFNPDTIIALGGGSVIDTCKSIIAVMSCSIGDDVFSNRFNSFENKPFFIAVPTTAGSGSEATHFAVLYKDKIKHSIAHEKLLPDMVLLDAVLTLSCPPILTLSSGVDAVCQAVESYWSKNSTVESKGYSIQSLELLLNNIFEVLDKPDDLKRRSNMLYGAHLAGKAINISKTTAGHALSYGLTSNLGLPHGISVLMTMGPLIQLMEEKYNFFDDMDELYFLFKNFGSTFFEAFLAFHKTAFNYIDWSDNSLKILSDHLINNEIRIVDKLVKTINLERLSNHPVSLTNKDIIYIYEQAIKDLKKVVNVK